MGRHEAIDVFLPAPKDRYPGLFESAIFENGVSGTMGRGGVLLGGAGAEAVGDPHGLKEITRPLVPGRRLFGRGMDDTLHRGIENCVDLSGQGGRPGQGAVLVVYDFELSRWIGQCQTQHGL